MSVLSSNDKVAAIASCYPLHSSPQKMRLVADLIRGKDVSCAVRILRFSTKKASFLLASVLSSAIANAQYKGMDLDDLRIDEILVDKSIVLKRMHPRAMGRGCRIRKVYSRVKIKLMERGNNGTKG